MMNTFGSGRAPNSPLSSHMPLLVVFMLPMLVAAQQEPLEDRAPLSNPQDPVDTTPPILIPPDTHASRQAPLELMLEAARQPENIIGKTLVISDGMNDVMVGPILDLRRRLQDEELYLIVDATTYFNTATDYAVALRDVARMEGSRLVIPEAPGMHLLGLDYYANDYTDIEEQTPE
jgi:hypothetical protein